MQTSKRQELQEKEADREAKRRKMEELAKQFNEIKNHMDQLEAELVVLDNEIDMLEDEVENQGFVKLENETDFSEAEFLTDPMTQQTKKTDAMSSLAGAAAPSRPLPCASTALSTKQTLAPPSHSVIARGVTPLQLTTNNHHHLNHRSKACTKNPTSSSDTGITTLSRINPPTLDAFFAPPPSASITANRTSENRADPSNGTSASRLHLSEKIQYHLQHTFRIAQFRHQQEEVIHATLQGKDVFVIMRTGGGKSLTYQLPAILERYRKVTFVVSPLLSLIQDQEEQMNAFAAGSATSFTSSISASMQAERWNRLGDPQSGVCLVFLTPEKIQKSLRLKKELQKLYDANRLGRFVIDEAHCSSQWGHDFRPDYAQLGILKRQFPRTPIMAVTATASNKVRDDVCRILKIQSNYQFFRSSANRPNLTYSVRPKPGSNTQLIEDMAEYIKTHHARDTGIVYTFTKKEADTVAQTLDSMGISAASYHAAVSASRKEIIHRQWMNNQIQVVVATIAFGLGINKTDVRFVLHHSMSKTLDAYYQESGRAGRDGLPADCVLYYCPKDVPRMIKLVHGSSAEPILWPMIRYAQASGNDAVCKAIILSSLSEPNCQDPKLVQQQYDGIATEPRDVGFHAQTVTQLLIDFDERGDLLTLNMLVKEWRKKPGNAAPCVEQNPPSDLSVGECERIVVALILEEVLNTNVVWNAYDGTVYLVPGKHAASMAASPKPMFVVRFPLHEKATKAKKPKAASKPRTSKTAKATTGKKRKARKKKVGKPPAKKSKTSTAKSIVQKKQPIKGPPAVIDLVGDSEDEEQSSDDEPIGSFRQNSRQHIIDSDSESEFELE